MAVPSTIWSPAERNSDALEVYLLGMLDYDAALFLQERLIYEISGRSDTLGGVLVCEHPPLVTIGREGSREHLLVEQREFAARLIEVRWLNRGGGCVLHAPGQLALYPIVPLDRLNVGLADYRRRLQQTVIAACREQRINAFTRGDDPGIFARTGQIASLGVGVKSWVAHHGLFLNVAPPLDLLRMVRWNLRGERPTSLAAESLRPVSMHSVREALIRHLSAQLGYQRHHIYTGHPLLRPTRRKIHAYA